MHLHITRSNVLCALASNAFANASKVTVHRVQDDPKVIIKYIRRGTEEKL